MGDYSIDPAFWKDNFGPILPGLYERRIEGDFRSSMRDEIIKKIDREIFETLLASPPGADEPYVSRVELSDVKPALAADAAQRLAQEIYETWVRGCAQKGLIRQQDLPAWGWATAHRDWRLGFVEAVRTHVDALLAEEDAAREEEDRAVRPCYACLKPAEISAPGGLCGACA